MSLSGEDLFKFAKIHKLKIAKIDDLIAKAGTAIELIKGGPMSPRTTSEAEPQILPPIADATEKELNESKEKGEEKEYLNL